MAWKSNARLRAKLVELSPRSVAAAHLRLRLAAVHRALQDAVSRQAALAARLQRPDLKNLCVTDDHAKLLLERVADVFSEDTRAGVVATAAEAREQTALRGRAAATGRSLPLDRLNSRFGLSSFEQDALLLCAGPELDRAYERLYGYLHDDLTRRLASVELVSEVCARSPEERIDMRALLGPNGRLRRTGLVESIESISELRTELRLAPALLDWLWGGEPDPLGLFGDPAEVGLDSSGGAVPADERFERIASAIGEGRVDLLGLWGARTTGVSDWVEALARRLDWGLMRWEAPAQARSEDAPLVVASLREIAAVAVSRASVLWIATEGIPAEAATDRGTCQLLAELAVPVFLTGRKPWRPLSLLSRRRYDEVVLEAPDFRARRDHWRSALPELPEERASDWAARFRLAPDEVRAAAGLARSWSPQADGLDREVERALGLLTESGSGRFTKEITPRHGFDDLVLPEDAHGQVMDVARWARSWPSVASEWGFGREHGGGVKALFTGDPGTGKTLAAEVVAGELGVRLLKVDMAQAVSKWVGETEKNLDRAFEEAERSHAVLFFDEADGLFGKRGESRTGTDRYANLEVNYLLQRLEEYAGTAILATNHHSQIDPAFLRRFQVIVHFARPGPIERARLWQQAFPPEAPRAESFDLEQLVRLDLTGASIVSTARIAALAARRAGRPIEMRDVVEALERQYQHEGRILRPDELGPHASLRRTTA